MKKIFVLLFTIILLLPLCAQEAEPLDPGEILELDESMNNRIMTGGNDADEEQPEKQDTDFGEGHEFNRPSKKHSGFARQYFEFGYNLGVGLDNGLMGISDIIKKDIEINMSQIAHDASKDEVGLNFDICGDFFITIMNIPIGGGLWDFGVSGVTDGGINFSLSQSLISLITEGKAKQHSSTGIISVSGGIYADTGLVVSAQYADLKVGIRPAVYTPLAFIPKSGITYHLQAGETEALSLEAGGEIIIYSPFIGNSDMQFGSDLSLEGEYTLFSFLDVGGSLSHIPLAAAQLEHGMRLTLDKDKFNYKMGLNLEDQDAPELDFQEDNSYKNFITVYRPVRFDVFARYKPLNSEFLIIKPNCGFSVDINEKEGYFNAGVEGQLNHKDMFIVHLGTGYQETIWKHRLGFTLNLRVFQLDMEGSLRSQNFIGSFKGQGFGFDMGMRFGW